MVLTYKFDSEDDYGFDKHLSQRDLETYFKSLSTEEQLDALKAAFESFDKDSQHFILGEFEEPNYACPDFGRWLEEDIGYCMDIFTEAEDLFEDELHDFFEDEAYNDWEEEMRYMEPSDPYAARGLRQSDFF